MDVVDLRTKFLKIFANVPDKIRSEETIAVIDKLPYTWSNAAIEIKNNTETGKEILKKLNLLGII